MELTRAEFSFGGLGGNRDARRRVPWAHRQERKSHDQLADHPPSNTVDQLVTNLLDQLVGMLARRVISESSS